MAKADRKPKAVESQAVEVEVKAADAEPGFVTVRNMGSRAWIGSDYAPGKVDVIAAGESAAVTERRAAELVLDYRDGTGGVGPFVVVGG